MVTRLNADINALINSADVRERMAALGAEPAGGTPEEFGKFIESEMKKWERVVKEGGIKAE